MTTSDVKVHIYDLSRGMARALSMSFLGKQLDGIWHTGIVAYGQEFYFGGMGGIEACPPCGTILGAPDTVYDLGKTQVPYDMFMDYLAELSQTSYRPSTYHLLDHNCNTFSSDIAQFLTGNDIPSNITGLPAEVMSTPFGQMIRPFIDSMSVQPSGGHAVFPGQGNQATNKSSPQNPSQATTMPGAGKALNAPGTKDAKSTPTSVPASGIAGTKPTQNNVPTGSTPVVHSQEIPADSWKQVESAHLPAVDMSVVKEVCEYIQQTDATWSLGRPHLKTVSTLACSDVSCCQTWALQLLQKLLLHGDVIQLIQHDPMSSLPAVLHMYDQYDSGGKEELVKAVTNGCSSASGHGLLLSDRGTRDSVPETYNKLTGHITVTSLLSDCETLRKAAAALSYNISLYKVSEDVQLEIATALLTCIDNELEEIAAYHCLTALKSFLTNNLEVKGLASVLGANVEPLKKLSDRVLSLCNSIESLL